MPDRSDAFCFVQWPSAACPNDEHSLLIDAIEAGDPHRADVLLG